MVSKEQTECICFSSTLFIYATRPNDWKLCGMKFNDDSAQHSFTFPGLQTNTRNKFAWDLRSKELA